MRNCVGDLAKRGVIGLVRLTEQAIQQLIERHCGREVLPLVDVIKGRHGVSETFLMQKLKADINTVRNLLYKLHREHLVSFTRERDKKRGWYLYYWSLNEDRIRFLIRKNALTRMEQLNEILQHEGSTEFYACPAGCVRLDFDTASELLFRCPECGTMMEHSEKENAISRIKRDIEKLAVQVK